MLTRSALDVVDLFAGAGFLSRAFQIEHFQILRAIEQNPIAASTYRTNVGDHVEVGDVENLVPYGRCDVLIGGPPCQGFSTLGSRDKNDPRNRLTMQMAEWAKVLRPKVVVMENVPSFLRSQHCVNLQVRFEALGYQVNSVVLNAADLGVPQMRLRCFVFASRTDMPVVNVRKRKNYRTVREAWDGLSSKPDGFNGHDARKPSPLALARMKIIPPGGDKRDVLRAAPHLAPESWAQIGAQATDVWGRILWDEPSNTLRTALLNPSKGRYIHPVQHRVITLREAARLQTIPDSWQFVGTPYQVARQIGNGVPLLLGRAIARCVRELF
ncbi:MAG: DNA cytosine methyltransferase [Gemmataceae bacterium]